MDQEPGIFRRCPKFHELDLIEANEKIVRVIEGGAGEWDRIATRLHFEGHMFKQIWTDSQHDTFRACQTTFTKWLDGPEGLRTPRTWSTVIKVLKEAGFGQLADDLKEVLDLLEKHSEASQESKSPTTATTSAKMPSATPTEVPGTFPLLKVPHISSENYKKLETRLYSESIKLTERFGRMFNNFFQSLSDRDVSIKKIVADLKAFGAFSPVYKRENQPLLRDELDRLNLATADIDDIKLITLDYCSFFNYRLLSSLVSRLGTPTDIKQIEKYEKKFNEYAKRRVFECPSEFGKLNTTSAILAVKLDSHYEQCSLNQLRLLETDFCKILNISILKLCLLTSGCLQLTFQLPWFVQKQIFPLSREQEEKLTELHVLRVFCGKYHFTVKKVPTQRKQEVPKKMIAKFTSAPRMPQKLPWMVRKEKYIQIGQQLYNQLEYEKFTTTASETTPTSTVTEMHGIHGTPPALSHYQQQGYDLKFYDPKGSHQTGEGPCVFTIGMSVTGPYEFPENFHLVSGILWLGCDHQLTRPITVTMQHCAKSENALRLSFARAIQSPGTLPYIFRPVGGNFTSISSDGVIELENFSGETALAIIQEGSDDRKYIAIPFYEIQCFSINEIHLIVTWDTKAHVTAAKEEYKNTVFSIGEIQRIEFESDELKLDIPKEGITLKEGWNITAVMTTVINKTDVDNYKMGKTFETYELVATSTRKGMTPILHHQITIVGAKEPHNKFAIDTSGMPVTAEQLRHIFFVGRSVWHSFGLALGLDPNDLDPIPYSYTSDLDSYLMEVSKKLLTRAQPKLTWKLLVDKLRSSGVGFDRLADEVREKYY